MKMIKISAAAATVVSLLASSAFADDAQPKRVLKNNMKY